MKLRSRPTPGLLPGRLAALLACLGALVCWVSAARPAARLLAADARGVTVEFTPAALTVDTVKVNGRAWSRVSLKDGAVVDAAGSPELPGEASMIGMPLRGGARLTVLDVQAEERGVLPLLPVATNSIAKGDIPTPVAERKADPAAYARAGLWPATVAALGPVSSLRSQRVQTFGVRPVRYDASRSRLWIARRIVVRIDFDQPATATPASAAAVLRGGGEDLLRAALLNYDQARAFRAPRAAARPLALRRAGVSAPLSPGFPDFKLRVDTTGVYSVWFDQLQRVSPTALSTIPLDQVRVFEKVPGADPRATAMVESEVPVRVVDVDGDGQFGPGDYLVFFGRNLADRFHAHYFDADLSSRYYTDGEVFWLGQRVPPVGGAWARMGPGGASGLSAPYTPASFHTTAHREDHWSRMNAPDYLDQEVYLSSTMIIDDTLAFAPVDVDAAKPIDFSVLFRGGNLVIEGDLGYHHVAMLLERPQGTGVLRDTLVADHFWIDKEASLYRSGPVWNGGYLSPAHDVLHLLGSNRTGAPGSGSSGAFLQAFDVGYYRKYNSPGISGTLAFTSGDTLGALQIRATNFRDSTLEVYDISDSANPRYIDTAGRRSRLGNRWQFTFLDTTTVRPHAYFAASRGFLPQLLDEAVVVDTPSTLAQLTGGDMILVTHGSLMKSAQALANLHASEGMSVRVADVQDVYDEFDGGRKSDVAIKRFVRQAFLTWNPAPRYLLLMGEASENPKGYLQSPIEGVAPYVYSHRDLVPAPHAFGSVPLGADYEVIPEDHWYVVGLDTAFADTTRLGIPNRVPFFPDLAVGRISVSTQDQADSMVAKIAAYSNFAGTDNGWRSRNLYVSDDTWSNGISFSGANPVLNDNGSSEHVFEDVTRSLRNIVTTEAGFPFMQADSFFLSQYSDTLHACDVNSGGFVARDWNCVIDWSRAHWAPVLWQKMSQGALIVNYQGHANSGLWAHEHIFVDVGYLSDDIQQVGNLGRPFLMVSFACHVNKFNDFREASAQIGDGMGERVLFAPGRGAIGSIASTGYEWLPGSGDLVDLNKELFRAFFVNPPDVDAPPSTRTRWVMGDVFALAKTTFLGKLMGVPPGQQLLWGELNWQGYDAKPPYRGGSENEYEAYSYCLLGDPALHMSTGDASFAGTLDGQPLGATPYLRTASRDSVTLVVTATAPAGLDSVWVQEQGTGGTRVPPRSAYSVRDVLDAGSAHPRAKQVTYRTLPAFEDYDVQIQAKDVRGAVSTYAVHRLLQLSAWSSDKGQLDSLHSLPSRQTLQITLTSSTLVDSTRFTLSKNGFAVLPTSVVSAPAPDGSGGLRIYTISYADSFPSGMNTVTFTATSPDGQSRITAAARFRVAGAGEFTLTEVINYPNPFEASTAFHYTLTQPVDALDVQIYTISGRRIRDIRDPSLDGGTHMLPWDGTDADGDPVANGTYLYRVIATRAGKTLQTLGKMVRVR